MFDVGEAVDFRELTTIGGERVTVPIPDRTVHLQFRRFASCPICSLHLRELARRGGEIAAAGIAEVVVFHSAAEPLRRFQADLPFAVIADPDRKLYKEFGVERSIRSIVHPAAIAGAARALWRAPSLAGALSRKENRLGKPADFLIAADGTVLARKYGTHADDQWSVDELLHAAASN